MWIDSRFRIGPFLCLIYINDLYLALSIMNEIYHFPDDTNFQSFNSCIKTFGKQVNNDLKNLANWLMANKTSLDIG